MKIQELKNFRPFLGMSLTAKVLVHKSQYGYVVCEKERSNKYVFSPNYLGNILISEGGYDKVVQRFDTVDELATATKDLFGNIFKSERQALKYAINVYCAERKV